MLLTQEVEIVVDIRTYDYYSEKGYVIENHIDKKGKRHIKKNTIIKVKVKDLTPHNKTKIKLKCDYCGKEFERIFSNYVTYKNKYPTINKDACSKCKYEKTKESNLLTYGVENNFQREDIKSTITNTNISKYGVDNYSKTDEFKKIYEEKYKEIRRVPYNKIKEYVDSIGGKLMTTEKEYDTSQEKLKFLCIDCGDIFETTWGTILKTGKTKCNECTYISMSGENNPNWNGGYTLKEQKIRKSREYKKWRQYVYERDNYTCQCCGDSKGHNLEAHHIRNFSEEEDIMFDIDNGITLCNKCHNPNQEGSFHNIYGTRNNTREQLEEYIEYYLSSNIIK